MICSNLCSIVLVSPEEHKDDTSWSSEIGTRVLIHVRQKELFFSGVENLKKKNLILAI